MGKRGGEVHVVGGDTQETTKHEYIDAGENDGENNGKNDGTVRYDMERTTVRKGLIRGLRVAYSVALAWHAHGGKHMARTMGVMERRSIYRRLRRALSPYQGSQRWHQLSLHQVSIYVVGRGPTSKSHLYAVIVSWSGK